MFVTIMVTSYRMIRASASDPGHLTPIPSLSDSLSPLGLRPGRLIDFDR
jgi:hypothetical protein